MENNEINDDLQKDRGIREVLTLRFEGTNEDAEPLHELRAEHVAQTLLGLTELANDFEEAGAFHEDGITETEILVKPAKEGSFLIEVMRFVTENPQTVEHVAYTVVGLPTLKEIVQWSVKATSDQVTGLEEMESGNLKITWRNGSVDEVTPAVWKELNKKKVRRRRQLRKIMAPLADSRVEEVEITAQPKDDQISKDDSLVLTKVDYVEAKPEDEVEESSTVRSVDGQIKALDFEDSKKWSVKVDGKRKNAEIVDSVFLEEVRKGLKVSGEDTFRMMIQEDRVKRNGRITSTKWTVLHLKSKEAEDGSLGDAAGGSAIEDSEE